jgi:hypothetical protein
LDSPRLRCHHITSASAGCVATNKTIWARVCMHKGHRIVGGAIKNRIAVTNALSCFTSPADGRPCLPSRPCRFRSAKKRARHERHRLPPNDRRASACGSATALRSGSVPASLRLRSTFPFAEPQAEAHYDRIGRKIRVESERQACCLLDGGWC